MTRRYSRWGTFQETWPRRAVYLDLGVLRVRFGKDPWRSLSERYPDHFPDSPRWRYALREHVAWSVSARRE